MSDDLRDAWDARSIRTWFEEEHERVVAEDDIKIVARCPVLWSGWEGDCGVVLYRLRSSGETGLHVLDGVHHAPASAVRMLEERLEAYREAARATEVLLALIEQDELMREIYRDIDEIGRLEGGDG